MKVLFILDHALHPYRKEFFEELSSTYEISIIAPEFRCHEIPGVRFIFLDPYRKRNILKLFKWACQYDVVVHMQNLRLTSLWLFSILPSRKFRLVHWGIGTSSKSGLGTESFPKKVARNLLMLPTDSIGFYSSFPIQNLWERNKVKARVIPNTVHIANSQNFANDLKEYFLFMGTLNYRKGLPEIFLAYRAYLNFVINPYALIICGDGPMQNELVELAQALGITEHVDFVGRVDDLEQKTKLYRRAVLSVSFNQAGLSILESFSYGVPFVCKQSAISGGEVLNVKPNITGFYVENSHALTNLFADAHDNREIFVETGSNAYQLYQSNFKMEQMVDAMRNCIENG